MDARHKGKFKPILQGKIVWISLSLGVFYWIADSVVHSLLTERTSFFEQLVFPGFPKVWFRLTSILVILGFGIYVQLLVNKRKQAEERLKETLNELDKLVEKRTAELANANEELQKSEREYRELVDNAPVGVYKTDLKGDILYVNETLARMFEFDSPEEMAAQGAPLRYKNPKDRENLFKILKEKGKVTAFDFDGLTKSGKIKNFIISSVLEGDTMSGMAIDITNRKKAEKELQKAHQELEKRVKERTTELAKTNEELRTEIAKRKQVEAELQQSEKHYRHLIELSPDAIVVTNLDTRILMANKQAAILGGYDSVQELLGKSGFPFITPKDRRRLRQDIETLLESGELSAERTYNILKKDGTSLSGEVRVSVVVDATYIPIGFVAAIRDITERKQAEEALRESEEKYRHVAENSLYGIAMAQEGKIIYANEAYCDMFGYPVHELIGKSLLTVVAPADRGLIRERAKKRFRGVKVPDRYEFRGLKKDGTEIFVEVSGSEAFIFKNKPTLLSVFADITERKWIEKALRNAAREWKTTFDAINDGVCLLDKNNQILRCNEAAADMLDKPFEEIIGHTCYKLLHGTPEPPKDCPFTRMQKTLRRETAVLLRNGRLYSIIADPLLDEAGHLVGAVHIMTDVTEHNRAEDELRCSREQLRNLSEHLLSVREGERAHIAREIHDELGQSLTALKMDLFWLKKRVPQDHKPLLEKEKSMSKLIDATIRKVQSLSTELRPGLLDDLGLVAAVEWQTEEFQKRTGIKCKLRFHPENIDVGPERSTVIFRIFQEALTNVARHAHATKIDVSLKTENEVLELRISDNGKGITEEQISGSKSIGLIGMRERVLFLGGQLNIKGAKNKGTKISIVIPLAGKEELR